MLIQASDELLALLTGVGTHCPKTSLDFMILGSESETIIQNWETGVEIEYDRLKEITSEYGSELEFN